MAMMLLLMFVAAFVYLITFYASQFVDAWLRRHRAEADYVDCTSRRRLHGRCQRHRLSVVAERIIRDEGELNRVLEQT